MTIFKAYDMFALRELGRGKVEGIRYEIDINAWDSPPVRQPPRRVPFSLRPTIRGLVNNMHSQDQGSAKIEQLLE